MNISSLIPNPLDFSRLSREDVGLPLLRVINSLPESLKHRYNYLTQPGTLDGYTVSDPAPVKEALNEAWGWLLSKGFIAPKPDDPNSGFVYVTQEGRKYLENMQAVEKMAEDKNLSVRPQVEGVIPGSKLSLGDTFLRFPLWARAALASRCAARVMPLFIPNVDHKREETRRAVIALDACWKLAGLASQGRFLAEDIVDRVASAIKFAQDAIKDERSPSYDAVEIAALAAQSGGYAHDLRPSVLMNIVTRHELAFSRLAGATGLGSGISIAATTSLNADISELETQTETKELSSEMKARAFFKEPLWRGLLNPSEINQMTAPWHMRLLELDFLDLYNSYMPMLLNSAAINWNMAIAEIRDWASGLSGVGGGLLDHEVTHSADALISAPVTDQLPNLGMLADVALEDDAADLLGYKAFAEALAGIIDCPDTSTPFVLSINAPWGAGKSTLALMIKRILTRKPSAAGTEPHVTCWFNAWMHDDAPNLASAFAAEVAQTADRKRPFWRRFIEPLPRALAPISKRNWVLPFLVFADLLLLCLCVAEVFYAIPFWIKASLGLTALTPLAWAQEIRVLAPFAQAIAKFVSDPKGAASTASMKEVSRQLYQLIQEATPTKSRFVIFIDDLDRCRPPRAVDVLEAVNQLLGHERIVTVIMGDMPAVAACAEIKYKDLSLRYVPSGDPKADKLGLSYGRAYLQKIIQLQFDLPAQATPVMSALMQQLVRPSPKAMPPQLEPRGIRQLCDIEGTRAAIDEEINTQVTSGEKDFTAVEKAVTDKLKNFPDSLMLEALLRERIQLHLSDDSELMREAQAEVMNYVEPYPRHAKRLLNRLRLLIFIAHERGMFGGDPYLSPRHIGKWAVLCERWPELAQSLSSKPELMVRLEQEDQYGAAINDIAPFYATDLVLKKFCLAGGDIKLASLTSRIVHFAPASHISP